MGSPANTIKTGSPFWVKGTEVSPSVLDGASSAWEKKILGHYNTITWCNKYNHHERWRDDVLAYAHAKFSECCLRAHVHLMVIHEFVVWHSSSVNRHPTCVSVWFLIGDDPHNLCGINSTQNELLHQFPAIRVCRLADVDSATLIDISMQLRWWRQITYAASQGSLSRWWWLICAVASMRTLVFPHPPGPRRRNSPWTLALDNNCTTARCCSSSNPLL